MAAPGRSEAGRSALRAKMTEYMDRAEWIKAHIDKEKTSMSYSLSSNYNSCGVVHLLWGQLQTYY